MNTQIIVHQDYTKDQLKVIKATVAKQTTMEQFLFFIEVCKHTGLSPFARQIYAVVRGGSDMTIQVSIDGYRVLAERTGKYAGQIGPEWCDESGEWKDVWLSNKPPVAARVGVLRRDFEKPIWGVARYAAYEQSSSPLWKKMPDVMLAKCAESLALRKAFPAQLSGIYTSEEMAQADGPLSSPVVTETAHDEQISTVEGEIVETQLQPSEKHASIPTSQTVSSPSQTVSQPSGGENTIPSLDVIKINFYDLYQFNEEEKADKWQGFKKHILGLPVADNGLAAKEIERLHQAVQKRVTEHAKGAA